MNIRLSKYALLLILIGLFPGSALSQSVFHLDELTSGRSVFPHFWNAYRQISFPKVNLVNGSQLGSYIQQGRLSLSLAQFLKLVVENNLDLENARYNYLIAQVDLLRARSGQAARGAPGATLPGALFAGAIGAGVGNNANVSSAGTGGTSISASARQITIPPRGVFDPVFSANMSWDHVISPLNTVKVSGTPTVAIPSADLQTRFAQELPTGSSYAVTFNVQRQTTTQKNILYNPAFTSYWSVAFYQPLLNGFGRAFNQRFVTLATNDRKIVYESFHTNLNNTLSAAANAYWDFVALREKQRVAEQALAFARKLYEDTQQRLDLGDAAPNDVLIAESRVASARRDLIVTQTNVQLQEVKLKSLITRVMGPDIDNLPFEPTDVLNGQLNIPIPGVRDALLKAMTRASLRQAELGLENQRIAESFTVSNLRPTLSFGVQVNDYTLAPGVNQMFRQLINYTYPEVSFSLSLSFPLKNRAAQADNVRASIERQQAEVAFGQAKSNVDVQVRTAMTSLTQTRSQVEAAEKAVSASQTALDAAQYKLQSGSATLDEVLQAQLDLYNAQAAEIQSLVNYAKSVIAERVAVGNLLESQGIDFDDALRGSLWTSNSKP